jgi:hypothetical protein
MRYRPIMVEANFRNYLICDDLVNRGVFIRIEKESFNKAAKALFDEVVRMVDNGFQPFHYLNDLYKELDFNNLQFLLYKRNGIEQFEEYVKYSQFKPIYEQFLKDFYKPYNLSREHPDKLEYPLYIKNLTHYLNNKRRKENSDFRDWESDSTVYDEVYDYMEAVIGFPIESYHIDKLVKLYRESNASNFKHKPIFNLFDAVRAFRELMKKKVEDKYQNFNFALSLEHFYNDLHDLVEYEKDRDMQHMRFASLDEFKDVVCIFYNHFRFLDK